MHDLLQYPTTKALRLSSASVMFLNLGEYSALELSFLSVGAWGLSVSKNLVSNAQLYFNFIFLPWYTFSIPWLIPMPRSLFLFRQGVDWCMFALVSGPPYHMLQYICSTRSILCSCHPWGMRASEKRLITEIAHFLTSDP